MNQSLPTRKPTQGQPRSVPELDSQLNRLGYHRWPSESLAWVHPYEHKIITLQNNLLVENTYPDSETYEDAIEALTEKHHLLASLKA